MIMRICEPKTKALIFVSDKMVATGAKSGDDSRLASCKYASAMAWFQCKVLQVQGTEHRPELTSSSPFAWRAWLIVTDSSAVINPRYASPWDHVAMTHAAVQLFPGLIYHMIKPKVVLLIFVSSKLVLTGAKVNGFLSSFFSSPSAHGLIIIPEIKLGFAWWISNIWSGLWPEFSGV